MDGWDGVEIWVWGEMVEYGECRYTGFWQCDCFLGYSFLKGMIACFGFGGLLSLLYIKGIRLVLGL